MSENTSENPTTEWRELPHLKKRFKYQILDQLDLSEYGFRGHRVCEIRKTTNGYDFFFEDEYPNGQFGRLNGLEVPLQDMETYIDSFFREAFSIKRKIRNWMQKKHLCLSCVLVFRCHEGPILHCNDYEPYDENEKPIICLPGK